MSAIVSPSANSGAIVFSGHSVRVDESTALRAEAAAASAEKAVAFGTVYTESDAAMASIAIDEGVDIVQRLCAVSGQVAPEGQLSWWARNPTPGTDPYFTTSGGVTWTETGLRSQDVLAAINTAIAALGTEGQRIYANRAAAVSALTAGVPVTVTRVGWFTDVVGATNLLTVFVGRYEGATKISDMPDWLPDGQETPQHWGGGPGVAAAVNSAAFDACAAYRGTVNVPPGTYQLSEPVKFDRRAGSGVQGVYLGGMTGDTVTAMLEITNNVGTHAIQVDQLSGTTVEYGFRPIIENIGLRVNMGATANAEVDWSAAISLRQCNGGLISNVVLDGFDVGVDCQRVVQTRFENITMRTALRSAGNHAKAFFIFDQDRALAAGKSFGNTVTDCECQPANFLTTVEKMFALRAVDGLEVLGGHYNNAKFHVDIAPTGSGGRTTVRDVLFNGVYFDCDNNVASPLIATINVAAIETGSSDVFGIRVIGCKARTQEGYTSNFFRFAGDPGDYDGLAFFRGLTIANNEIVGFGGGSCISLAMHSSYDETTLVSEVTITGNHFRDTGSDASHTAANKNAIVARGKTINISGNTYTGNWTDSGNAVVNISGDIDGYLIHGEVFNTSRAVPILIDAGVTGAGQSYGHTINGAVSSRVLGVVEEGTGANGYYVKYDNGRMTCLKTVSLTAVPVTTALGAGFVSPSLAVGDVAQSFSTVPQWFISARLVAGFGWLHIGGTGDVNTPPVIQIARFTSATADAVIDIRADGSWS